MAAAADLPIEIWELIFIFFVGDRRTMESLSLVSKEFLSITNCLRFCLTITDLNIDFLFRLIHRFPNLRSLILMHNCKRDDFDAILTRISTFPVSNIKSLRLSNCVSYIPRDGLRALSKKMTNLTSLTCSGMSVVYENNLLFFAGGFPLLEELELSYPRIAVSFDQSHQQQLLALPNLRKINISGSFFNRQSINDLLRTVSFFEESWRERLRTSTL